MQVVFRVDSATQIGSGHLMRCLTLATALRERGATCAFVCRSHLNNLTSLVRQKRFTVYELPQGTEPRSSDDLGVPLEVDAQQTQAILGELGLVDWLVVDHYGIDASWEQSLRPWVKRIFVIDDLANRPHDCDVLLDQNDFTDLSARYHRLCNEGTVILTGLKYSILRNEFFNLPRKIRPLESGKLKTIFIYFGFSDPFFLTLKSVRALCETDLVNIFVVVILSEVNSSFCETKALLESRGAYRLYKFCESIGTIMASCDLAIGAGGTTAKERIALGLPSIVISYGKDQNPTCLKLHKQGLIHYLGNYCSVSDDTLFESLRFFAQNLNYLTEMSKNCLKSGVQSGVDKICKFILGEGIW